MGSSPEHRLGKAKSIQHTIAYRSRPRCVHTAPSPMFSNSTRSTDLALPFLSLAGARDEQAHSDDKHRHKFLHELGLALHLLHRVRCSDQLFPGDRPADCVITVMPSLFYTLRFNTDAMAEPGMPVQSRTTATVPATLRTL